MEQQEGAVNPSELIENKGDYPEDLAIAAPEEISETQLDTATATEAYIIQREQREEDEQKHEEYERLRQKELEEYEKNRKRRRRNRFLVIIFAVVSMAFLGALFYVTTRNGENTDEQEQPEQTDFGPPPISFKKAAVVTTEQLCTSVGKSILVDGGNAIDASVAIMLCLGVVSPHTVGIGGGFFMTFYQRKDRKVTAVDAREVAPIRSSENMFYNKKLNSKKGGSSIAVFGAMKGYSDAHRNFGKLSWKELFEPSIKLAEEGFPVPVGLAVAMVECEDFLMSDPVLRSVFVNPSTGRFYNTNETMKRLRLAKTLRIIADEGADAVYKGSLTDTILDELGKAGSAVTRRDLNRYEVKEKEPIELKLSSGKRVYSTPAPSGGPILFYILNLVDGFHLRRSSLNKGKNKLLTYHRIIEAFKFAYAKRTHMGDEDFVDVHQAFYFCGISLPKLTEDLLSTKFADSIRKQITDDKTHNLTYYKPYFYNNEPSGTDQLAVMDEEGNAVSVTADINTKFGSGVMGFKTGIIYNNEMDDFSTPNLTNAWGINPSPANFIKPGKRPLSSMCPSLVVSPEGDVIGNFGSVGGAKITTTTAWVMIHSIILGDNIRTALSRPRLHHQLMPNLIMYEDLMDRSLEGLFLIKGLEGLGHKMESYVRGSTISHAIVACPDQDKGRWCAYVDPRIDSQPDGF